MTIYISIWVPFNPSCIAHTSRRSICLSLANYPGKYRSVKVGNESNIVPTFVDNMFRGRHMKGIC